MPKPIYGDNGSGMHMHQSIWKDGKPLFAGTGYADLSDTGALLHRRHHQARQGAERLHQPDDQQLQAADPGLRGAGAARLFGAQPLGLLPHPVHARARRASASRSASPIPAANPYLGFAAMLMAGLDGIQNKIHPGDADRQEPLRPAAGGAGERAARSAARCARRSAHLDAGRDFLKKGDVFTDDLIDGYIELKMGRDVRLRAHPPPGRVPDVLLGVTVEAAPQQRQEPAVKAAGLPLKS